MGRNKKLLPENTAGVGEATPWGCDGVGMVTDDFVQPKTMKLTWSPLNDYPILTILHGAQGEMSAKKMSVFILVRMLQCLAGPRQTIKNLSSIK